DGSIIAIGAPRSDGIANNSGHVRVFENIGGSWIQIGQDIDGEQEQGRLGNSVALNGEGNIVAIGASQNDENGTNTGEVKVYENIDGTWTQLGGDINGVVEFEDSGSEVALSQVGNIMAISSPSSNANGLHSGLVRIFEYLGGVWTQIGEDINGEASEDYFGWSIALSASGNVIAIGALWNDDNGFNSGHVKIYQNIGGEWTQIGENINGEAASDESGFSVDISDDGSTVAIGAKANDGNGDFSGHVRVFDLSSIILSLPGYDLQNNISIFPIPSDESISINGIGDDILAQFSIFDSRGKLIRSEAETIGSIDISDLSMGIYYLRIESSSSTIVLKFIKE
ncbi:MAG: T9SS type A sorting domain-containing protein, partial [Flavobacteriales bacterium]|nr:T9SS type A sorting domain-containing protein [Flavobacteriales bacterium]